MFLKNEFDHPNACANAYIRDTNAHTKGLIIQTRHTWRNMVVRLFLAAINAQTEWPVGRDSF